MKVLQVVEPGLDGVFRHVESLAGFLLQAGVQVSLAYSSIRGSDRLDALVERIQAAGFSTLDLRVGNAPQVGDVSAFFRLLRLVRAEQFDVIHLHSSKAGALGRLLRLVGVRTPLLYTPNAYYGMNGTNNFKKEMFNGVERLFRGIGLTVNVSNDEADWARRHLGLRETQQQLVPNAVDTTVFVPGDKDSRADWRHRLDLQGDVILLGAVGRLSYQKDPHTLYRALVSLLSMDSRIHLCQLASGTREAEDDLTELARSLGITERVHRLPYMADPVPFYRGIDAFLSTSRYEGLSFAVLEALACDLPLVLSDVVGNRDFLRLELSHVWSAPAEDVPAFSLALKRWYADIPARRTSNHRTTAERRFSFESCYGEIFKTYVSVADGNRGRH